MRQWKLAAGSSRAVAKPRMQTRPKRGSRKKPVSCVLLLVIAAMLLFALAPASTTTVIPDSQLVIGNVTEVCPDEIQAGNTTIDAEQIKSDLNDVTAYSGDGLTGTEIKRSIHDFVAASEEPVNSDDIVSFVNGEVMGASADETSFGTEYVFNSAETGAISVSAMSATNFVVAYRDYGNSGYGKAVIGTVTGNSIAYGSEYVFNSAATNSISVSAMNATNFVVAYMDGYGKAVIGTVTGNSIAYGSEYVFNSAFTVGMSVSALDATNFVVAYPDYGNSYFGTAVIGTVAGNTITYGLKYVFNSAWTGAISVSALDATNFVVAYQDGENSDNGTARIGSVAGNSIAYGSEYVFNSEDTDQISVSARDETIFVVAYCDHGNSYFGTAVIGTVTGNSIAYGTENVFNSASTESISVSALDATNFAVAYMDDGNSGYGTAVIGTVTGNSIAYGTENVFNSASTESISVSALDATNFAVAYMDDGNSGYGTAVIGTVTPGFAAPNITSSAPESPVNDTYCTWTKFNVTVDQTVNVTWYLNGTPQTPANESVTEANYTFHAEYIDEQNVSAVAENANGTDMQTWIWNVTAAPTYNCECGNICVNTSGWWRNGGVLNSSGTPILAAVDNATAGETIYVWNGSYTVNVNVNKRVTLRGEGADVVTVTAKSADDHVFDVTAELVNISGFNVSGATGSEKAGICLCDSMHCSISGITAAGNCYGIYLMSSSNNNTLVNITANSNAEAGIYMSNSNDNNITDNTASQTVLGDGIYMSNANNNKLTNNNASYNTGGSLSYGIYLTSSSDNTFSNNTANSNPYSGIWLNSSSNNNTFINNTASSNNYTDFYSTSDSRNNTVEDLFISSYPTTVSFIYGNGVGLEGVKNAPDDPAGRVNISKYVNATNVTADSWLYLNVSYEDSDVPAEVEEASLRMWRYNGSWYVVAGSGVNEAENYVYANITEFSVFAPLGDAAGQGLNCTCGDICVNTTGWWRDNGTFNASTTRIQDAIGNASAGNTVYVYNCSYTENVNVNKQLTLRGEGAEVVNVTAKSTGDHVFEVTADYVNISGFNVSGATIYPMAGIFINMSQHCNITNNTATGNYFGIRLYASSNNTITSNTASSNSQRGIYLFGSSNNTITSNTASNNSQRGIYLAYSSNNNTITSNTAAGNDYGIYLDSYILSASHNHIYNNYFSNTNNAWDNGNNIWNTTPIAGTNIIGGQNLGGNYWSDYAGVDNDGDGLGDTLTPYNSNIDNGGDYHPLVPAAARYIPPAPINMANETGSYWVNYTWTANTTAGNNVTDAYNVSNGTSWINGTNTWYNETVGPSGWLNITVWAYNASGSGTLSEDNVSDEVQAPAAPAGTYIPPAPINMVNETGNYWVNYTWAANVTAGNNGTDAYNVSNGTSWINGTNTWYNETVGPSGWLNITVWAFNVSGGGTLSVGSISDEVQAPAAPVGTYIPPVPINLANVTGNYWVNYSWTANVTAGNNVTDAYNVSNGTSWVNGTNTWFNESVGPSGWLNITVWAFNVSGGGTLSVGSISDEVQAPAAPVGGTPNITSFAPESEVTDIYGTRRKFNVTVNQTVNVTWYLNETFLFKNESVTDAEYTLHAQYIGENNVTAVAENANGADMQTWVWNVTAATIAIEVNKTVLDPKTGNWEKVILANVSDELQFRILVHNNGTENLTNITVNDTLSAGLEYVTGSATVNGGDCEPPGLVVWANSLVWYYDGRTCTDPFKNLSYGQNITIVFNVSKIEGGKDRNCVNVSGWFNDTVPDVQVFDDDYTVVRGQRDDTVIFRSGTWYVDTTGNHLWDDSFAFGTVPGDVPVVGDINQDGRDDTAIFRSGTWYVDTTGNHLWDDSFAFGTVPGDVPVVGDINRDGLDDTAIFRSGTWYVDTTGNHLWDDSFEFGLTPGDVPVVGDINRDGLDDTAIFRSGTWYVDTTGNHLWDISFEFGVTPGDVPVVGDINHDGLDDTTIFRSGTWYVDTSGNHQWDDSFEFGLTPGDVPLVGDIYGFAIEVNKTVWDSKTEEWVDGIKADLNAEVRFKIWILNSGTSSLTNISVNDTMSASLEYAAGNATVNDVACEPEEISEQCLKWYYNASRTCTSPFLNIHPGENVTIEFNATKNMTSDDTNCVNVSAWYNETGSHVQVVDEDSAGVYGWFDDVAIFRSGTWYVDTEGNYIRGTGGWTESFTFGLSPGDVPLVGDINRDGRDDVAIFRSGTWYVDTTGNYKWDESFTFGSSPSDVPVVGDINRDGKGDVAIFRIGTWYVDTEGNYINHTGGGWTESFTFGASPGDVPVVGDINQDGRDDIAIFRSGTWYVDTEGDYINETGGWDKSFTFGSSPGDVPVVGDINRDGTADTAIFRSGTWYVDTEGNYIGDNGGWDKSFTFGERPGDVPIVGDIK